MNTEIKKISITNILEDLNNGLTRFPDNDNYFPNIGSIQEKYQLEVNQVQEIFKHPKLKGKKTKPYKKPDFILVDDTYKPNTATKTGESLNQNEDFGITQEGDVNAAEAQYS